MIEYLPAAIASLKASRETVKLIIDAPKQLEKTEMELRLASINRNLFEAENALLESQKLLAEKDRRIAELEELLKFKGNLVRKDGMYFQKDENGNLTGEPYCPKCWEVEKVPVHLNHIEELFYNCPNCEKGFGPTPKSWKSHSTQHKIYW